MCGTLFSPPIREIYLVELAPATMPGILRKYSERLLIDGVGSSNQEELVQRAIQPRTTVHLGGAQNGLERSEAGGVTYNKSILGRGLDRPQRQKSRKAPKSLLDPHGSPPLAFS